MAPGRQLLLFSIVLVATTMDVIKAANSDCNSMTFCDLNSELQEHSKLIAGFSYNVKKADNALTQLRAGNIILTSRLHDLEDELEVGENDDAVLLTNQEAINKLTLENMKLETSIDTLSTDLDNLMEEVNITFQENIQNNDKNLYDLQSRVVKLNTQAERINAIISNHTEHSGQVTSPEKTTVSGDNQKQISALKIKHNQLESKVKQLTKSCMGTGKDNSVTSLGIELETVKSSYDTLQDQVTELQDKSLSMNEQLQRMLGELTRMVEVKEQEIVNGDASRKVMSGIIDPTGDGVTVVRISTPP